MTCTAVILCLYAAYLVGSAIVIVRYRGRWNRKGREYLRTMPHQPSDPRSRAQLLRAKLFPDRAPPVLHLSPGGIDGEYYCGRSLFDGGCFEEAHVFGDGTYHSGASTWPASVPRCAECQAVLEALVADIKADPPKR